MQYSERRQKFSDDRKVKICDIERRRLAWLTILWKTWWMMMVSFVSRRPRRQNEDTKNSRAINVFVLISSWLTIDNQEMYITKAIYFAKYFLSDIMMTLMAGHVRQQKLSSSVLTSENVFRTDDSENYRGKRREKNHITRNILSNSFEWLKVSSKTLILSLTWLIPDFKAETKPHDITLTHSYYV